MTRWSILGGLTFGVYLLQVTVAPQLLLYRFRIDFLLAWVISYALLSGPKRGLAFGLSVGLLLDLSGHPFGLHMLSKGMLGYSAGLLYRTFFREQLKMPLLIVFIALFTQELVMYSVYWVAGGTLTLDSNVLGEYLLMVVYNFFFAAWFYRLLAELLSWLDRTST